MFTALAGLLAAAPDVTALHTRLVVWGTMHRLIAAVLFLASAQMYHQLLPLIGRNGLSPLGHRLHRLRVDYPRWCVLYHPSVFWICSADWFIKAVILVCAAAAAAAFWGGLGHTSVLFAVCFVTYASLNMALEAHFPWDDMILEAGFVSLFLPPLPSLAVQWSASEVPSALVAFSLRWLLFRVLLGFGKFKVGG
jgi:hypothetical protein